MDNMYVVLCDEKTNNLWVNESAKVSDGCLKISGQDLGKAVEDIIGKDEYEYFYDFDQENTESLFGLLGHEAQNVKEIFVKKFSGIDGCQYLREFCEANDITYKFFSCKLWLSTCSEVAKR